MSFPIIQLFGCGITGCETPVEPVSNGTDPEPVVITPFDPDFSYLKNGMPLIPATTIDEYETALEKFQTLSISPEHRNQAPPNTGTISFDKYSISLKTPAEEAVYPITSCYLHWLHSGKSHPTLLDGAVTQPDENILIMKPLSTALWGWWHPGKMPALKECAYLNVELNEEKMKLLIQRSATQKYHQRLYKQIKGIDIADKPDWYNDYFELFRDNPEVPIVINPTETIGKITGADISLYFKMGDRWAGHMDDVETFFRYYQRYDFLIGHPLICMILARLSVRSNTVDIIRRINDKNGVPLWLRSKATLVQDFWQLATSIDPEYHPLAINTEEHPHRVVVPRRPAGGALPIQNLVTRDHHFLTRLKISNPLSLPVTIEDFNENHVVISNTNFSTEEQIIELSAVANLPSDVTETSMKILTDGDLIHILNLTFFEFRTISVKFHKLTDYDEQGNPIHQADMDEARLRELLLYANEIIGRQTNTYIVPVPTAEGGILHELGFNGNIGDTIGEQKAGEVTKQVFEQVSNSQNKKATAGK
jgi:hypothetical protein